MKARESAMRLKRFTADEMARKVADLEHMIREFDGMASDLDRQIKAEEERTGVRDPAHFAYSTFAKSASQRRDNLKTSADGLRAKLEAALRERDEALEQVARADTTTSHEQLRNRRRSERTAAVLR
ncbi:flagellar export protein FliJ [Hyphomicrobium sp. NDB2Meth4]|uniref:flagellar export protein FliJ n=1 Tax=Hyphomicrobium sp. NDB2Meth4 TaxID=1892846 RepID=UPI000930F297|nr:flagellar export protein FliJ [Hyphomicrobium sp. NDB2Meth4]